MEIRVLKYFLAVAKEESISKAAEVLHLTQPTLSRQIMDLEIELKTKLLVRGKRNKKIILTDDGKLLKARALEIVELANRTESEFLFDEKNISGDIYIGGGETNAMRIVAEVAQKLSKEYPHIKYHLYSGNGDDVAEKMHKGLLDFGLFIEPIDKKEYEFISLGEKDIWGILVRQDAPIANKKYIEPNDLKDIPILTSRQQMIENLISGWLGYNFENLNIIGTYNLLFNASLMVESRVGAALCLDKIVTGNNKLCFIPLKPALEVGIVIAWRKNQILSKAAKLFLQRLQSR